MIENQHKQKVGVGLPCITLRLKEDKAKDIANNR